MAGSQCLPEFTRVPSPRERRRRMRSRVYRFVAYLASADANYGRIIYKRLSARTHSSCTIKFRITRTRKYKKWIRPHEKSGGGEANGIVTLQRVFLILSGFAFAILHSGILVIVIYSTFSRRHVKPKIS